jgi:hypothetical protein
MSIITNGISKEQINSLFNPKSDCNQDDIYYNNKTECINRNDAVKFCNIGKDDNDKNPLLNDTEIVATKDDHLLCTPYWMDYFNTREQLTNYQQKFQDNPSTLNNFCSQTEQDGTKCPKDINGKPVSYCSKILSSNYKNECLSYQNDKNKETSDAVKSEYCKNGSTVENCVCVKRDTYGPYNVAKKYYPNDKLKCWFKACDSPENQLIPSEIGNETTTCPGNICTEVKGTPTKDEITTMNSSPYIVQCFANPSPSPSSDSEQNIFLIIAIAVASFVGFALLVGTIFYIFYRQRKMKKKNKKMTKKR